MTSNNLPSETTDDFIFKYVMEIYFLPDLLLC